MSRTMRIWTVLQLMFGAWLGGVFITEVVTALLVGAITLAVLYGLAAVLTAAVLVVALVLLFRSRDDELNPHLQEG